MQADGRQSPQGSLGRDGPEFARSDQDVLLSTMSFDNLTAILLAPLFQGRIWDRALPLNSQRGALFVRGHHGVSSTV